jgi:peroxiredoxin
MASPRQTVSPGTPAPDFRLPLLGGSEASLRELLEAGPLLLAFFKVSCPVCQLTFPFLERIHAAGGLRVYGVSQNCARDTADFNREYGITFPTLLDPESRFPASNAYGIANVPTLFLVEAGGAISSVVYGWNKRDVAGLAARAGTEVFFPGDYVPEWKAGRGSRN